MKTAFKLAMIVMAATLLGLSVVYFILPGVTADFLHKTERKAGGLSQHSIVVDGIRIEYLKGGRGDPLLLLHGFGADKDNWTRIARYLTPHVSVIAPDLPGFGETELPRNNDYTILVQVKRLRAFIEALGIESLHMGGSSMGGAIAGAYASLYPKGLMSLALFAPAGVAASDTSDMFRIIDKGQAHPLIAKDIKGYEYLLDFVFKKQPFIPGPVIYALAQKAIIRYPLYQEIYKQIIESATTPLEVLLAGLPAPTLIIWGDQDRVLHVSGANILGSVIPNSQVEVINAVGHLPMLERPRKTATIYLRFLESL